MIVSSHNKCLSHIVYFVSDFVLVTQNEEKLKKLKPKPMSNKLFGGKKLPKSPQNLPLSSRFMINGKSSAVNSLYAIGRGKRGKKKEVEVTKRRSSFEGLSLE